MKLAVLGATGFVGRILLQKLIDSKHDVKVLARNPEKLGDLENRVEVIKGDYFNPEALKMTLKGTDVVLSTIGASSKNSYDKEKYINAMQNLISIMNESGPKRIIIIGGAATPNSSSERFDLNRRILKFIVNSMGKHFIQIKEAECQIIMKSKLDWTIIRPPRVVNGSSNKSLCVDENRLNSLQVTVNDLADFMIQQIGTNKWLRKTPIISL